MNSLHVEETAPTRRRVLMLLGTGAWLVACGTKAEEGVTPEVQQGLMARWNVVAQGVKVDAFGKPDVFDFLWTEYERFPHPTFKGGSVQAYQRFADLLAAFFERDDDFDYLTQNDLLRTPLRIAPGDQGGRTWTFEQLATDASTSAWAWANISPETIQKLQGFTARMRML